MQHKQVEKSPGVVKDIQWRDLNRIWTFGRFIYLITAEFAFKNGDTCTKERLGLRPLLFPLIIIFVRTYITLDLLLFAGLARD